MAGVKAKWLSEVQEILNNESFRSWFEELERVRQDLRWATERYEDLLAQANMAEFRSELAQKNAIDTLYRASEYEDSAARMLAEATDLENRSMENLGAYEEQRMRTSELWFRVEALEHELDEAQRAGNDARARDLERQLRRAREEYERESAKKQRLWDEVEALWSISLEKNLSLFERRMKGKLVRRQAEKLFQKAEEAKKKAEALKADADEVARERERLEEQVNELIDEARERFEAVIHEDFMYWQQRENDKRVWVAPLFSDLNNYNITFQACRVYQCDRSRGVEFLEPIIGADKVPQDDPRLDEFFLQGRKRASGGRSSEGGDGT